ELEAAGPLDLVVGPSGYGVPITRVQDITEEALRLAFLAAPGETGGIGGLRNLVRALARTALPVVLTPGVVHLPTVPAHRKVNRVDMGTAEKVCAVALAVSDQARRLGSPLSNVSLVLLELGARSRPPWRSQRAGSWTGWGVRPGRSGFAPRGRSTARSPISRARCPRRCCSGAARPASPVGTRRPPRPSALPIRRRPRSRSPATRWSKAP